MLQQIKATLVSRGQDIRLYDLLAQNSANDFIIRHSAYINCHHVAIQLVSVLEQQYRFRTLLGGPR